MAQIQQVAAKLNNLKVWLNERGAELLVPTNEFEVLRFRTSKGTSVIYTKKNGAITFTGEAETAWNEFLKAGSWRANPATPRRTNATEFAALRARDGDLCFYCQEHVDVKDASEEHLVSLTHGGPNHISNKFLTHRICNQRVGNLSAPEKIKIHVSAVMRVAANKLREIYATKDNS